VGGKLTSACETVGAIGLAVRQLPDNTDAKSNSTEIVCN
jgi:hypothetical protein